MIDITVKNIISNYRKEVNDYYNFDVKNNLSSDRKMEKKLELEKIIEKNNENEKDNDDIINMNKELINKITILKI